MINNYLMRSLMFVPAHNEKLMDSALRREADVLLLDIEKQENFSPCKRQGKRTPASRCLPTDN